MFVTKLVKRIVLVALLWSPAFYGASSRGLEGDFERGASAGAVTVEGDQVSKSVEGPRRKLLGGKFIMIDAGHGGSDPGAVGNGIIEKELNLKTARLLKTALENKGHTVAMTRSSDVSISLSRRAAMANRLGVDLFVSIHYNSFSSPSARGAEVFVFPSVLNGPAGDCARDVLAEVIDATNFKNRRVKTANFAVLRETSMAAILVEAGFISSPSDSAQLRRSTIIEAIAKAIANGIDQCL
ncbi:hypothetical protein BSKO_10902 [Bryopsis sp. KO-2023]|nr:hypothetical protein BSKO_10902 [Bryopsis sp. KO-2023]